MKGPGFSVQNNILTPLRNRLTVDVQHKLIIVKLGPERVKFNFDNAPGKMVQRVGQADL